MPVSNRSIGRPASAIVCTSNAMLSPPTSFPACTVTRASSAFCAMPQMVRLNGDSSAPVPRRSLIQVPGSSENEDRTWITTWQLRAYSTHRSRSTWQPCAANSNMSS